MLKDKIKTFLNSYLQLFKLHPLIFVGVLFSLVYGFFTMIFGSVNLSYFIGVTGVCTLILSITKLYGLKRYASITQIEDLDQGFTQSIISSTTKNMAVLASVMSFLHFSIAFVCTFFEEENPSTYGPWFTFLLAGITITKVVLSTINSIRTRKNHNTIMHHLKLIDNANALIAIGLMQRAIVYYVGTETARFISGLGGMFFSLCALFVCLTMFIKNKSIKL